MSEESPIRFRAPASSRTLCCGVPPPRRHARKTSASPGSVGYRLRKAAGLIRTGSAFARTHTLAVMMAIFETCIPHPSRNLLFRLNKEAEQ